LPTKSSVSFDPSTKENKCQILQPDCTLKTKD